MRHRSKKSWVRLGPMILLVGILGAACAPEEVVEEPEPTPAPEPEPVPEPEPDMPLPEVRDIKVTILPITPLVSTWLADLQGYFEDEGFESVEFVEGLSGAEAMQLLFSGDIHFSINTHQSAMQAIQEGFDIVSVAEDAPSTDGTEIDGRRDAYGILVAEDSEIHSPADLEGRTVGVSSIPGLIWMFAVQAIIDDGGNPDNIDFVEIPYSQVVDSLLAGTIDAGATLEPWTTVGLAAGVRAVSYPYVDVMGESVTLGGWYTHRAFVEDNPITVWKFVHAIQRANDDLARDEEFARRMVVEFTGLDEDLAQDIWLPLWTTVIDSTNSIQRQMEIMLDLGMLNEPVDVDSFIHGTHLGYCPLDICYHGFLDDPTDAEHHEEPVARPEP